MHAVFTVPSSWTVVEPGADPDAAIARAVDEVFATKDRDSNALARHWMRQRLGAAIASPEHTGAEVVLVAFPHQAHGSVVLPVSATMVRIPSPLTSPRDDPMRVLAAIAARDPSAQTVPVLRTVALRTHRVCEAAEAVHSELRASALEEPVQRDIGARLTHVPMLRARYVIPGMGRGAWYVVDFSALLGTDNSGLSELYLGLFDAFIEGIRQVTQ